MDKIILHVTSAHWYPALLTAAARAGATVETRTVGNQLELIATAWAATTLKNAVPARALGAERYVRTQSAARDIANARLKAGL